MNERRLRPVYLVGTAGSAYAFWYFATSGAALYAAAFGLATVFFLARLRQSTADS